MAQLNFMKKDKESNRERLLKLIDGDPRALRRAQKSRAPRQSFLNLGARIKQLAFSVKEVALQLYRAIKDVIVYLKKGRLQKRSNRFDLIILNRFLFVIASLLAIYIVVDFVKISSFNKTDLLAMVGTPSATLRSSASQEGEVMVKLEPLDDYLTEIREKDVFNPQRMALAGGENNKATDQAVRLVGVDWGVSPIAMIEDVNEGKTHFVKKGDRVLNFTIVDVYQDKVVLQYQDKLFELK